MTISKQLVEIMGGDLILESREGEGTRVRFTMPDLPLTDDGPSGDERGRPGRRARGQALVMVVEDDQASRYGLGAVLESEGYRVRGGQPPGSERALEDSHPG